MLIFSLSAFVSVNACDFSFKVADNKTSCKPGNVIEVTVELTLVHRSCVVAPSQTKFKTDGVKVLNASAWKQTGAAKYERTVKMEVLKDDKNKITLMALRSCDKGGGSGTFTLPKK